MQDTKTRHRLSPTVEIEVKHTRPENDLHRLAVNLAEMYNRVRIASKEETVFNKQEHNERRKAGDMTQVIFEVKERAREDAQRVTDGLPPIVRRRMDRLEGYDLEKCVAERRECLERAQEYRGMADERGEIVKNGELAIPQLERRIKVAQEFARS